MHEVLKSDLEIRRVGNQVAHSYAAWQVTFKWQRLTHVNNEPVLQNYDDNDPMTCETENYILPENQKTKNIT